MRPFSALLVLCALGYAAPRFSQSASTVPVQEFVEVTVAAAPSRGNPFLTARLSGELRRGGERIPVEGFCDSPDGSVFRIRFLATEPGEYRYAVRFESPEENGEHAGTFRAEPGNRKGLLRVDPEHPFHFVWAGTGEHYFWNGLTAYALMGWRDEAYIRAIIDRAARMKVNRLRVSLNGPRVEDASRWYEPVKPSADFRFLFGPWVAERPGDVHDPGWDVTRFDIAFWQKYERLVKHARERNVAVSVIFFLDGADRGADPFGKAGAFGEDEKRYYRYGAARLSAFANVVWDVTNEWHLFRNAWWVERIGSYLKAADPYKHLTSTHGRGDFPWMVSQWPDFAMYQIWDEEGGYGTMLKLRQTQAATGRAMPQVNEEYGYEDHYPVKWGGNRRSPARSADNRRRLAWEMTMAGCYQTTGERANRGEGHDAPATPGGWLNGGFDDSMTMLEGYRHMVDFFTSFEYWKLEPAPNLAEAPARVLAQGSNRYVVYLPAGGSAEVQLSPGHYQVRWFNPRTGTWGAAAAVEAGAGRTALQAPDSSGDWAALVERG